MPRTSTDAVKAILGSHYDTDLNPDLAPFVATANNLVDYVVSQDLLGVLGSATLELIERWLSGHFYQLADPPFQYKQTGNTAATFQGKTGMALDSTYYGQMAKTLDTTGTLAHLSETATEGQRKRVGIVWLGTTAT